MSKPAFGFDTTAEEVAEYLKDRINGKVILTTGVSPNGLGSYYVKTLAAHEPKLLILANRDTARAQETADAIKKDHPDVPLRVLKLDLADIAQIREAAKEVKGYSENIDVLMNNAGVMATPWTTTKDGLELQFAVNHIGHFLFTNLILDKILASGNHGRIVNISSGGYRVGKIEFDDWNFSNGKTYNKWKAYGQAKTANIAFSVELARRYKAKGLESFSVHPGSIFTNLGRHLSEDLPAEFAELAKLDEEQGHKASAGASPGVFKQQSNGTATHVFASFDPSIASHNGAYLLDCHVAGPEDIFNDVYNADNAQKLWKLSEKIVGQTFD